MRCAKARGLGAVAMVTLTLGARDASADCDPRPGASTCLTSDALWPKPGPQRFAYLASTELTAPGNFGLALVSTYQKRPIDLHVATPGPQGTDAPAIDDQVDTTLVTSFGIVDRLAAFVAIPATLYQNGGGSSAATGRPAPSSTSLDNPRLGAALSLLPRRTGDARATSVAVAAYAEAQLPTRSTADFTGEKGVVLAPTVAVDVRFAGRVTIAADLGARLRPVAQSFFGERQASQVLFGVGAQVDVLRDGVLGFGAEARTIIGFDARAEGGADPFGVTSGSARTVLGGEWLAAAHSAFLGHRFSVLGGGGGTLPLGGLVGIGRLRFVLGVAYTPEAPAPGPATAPSEPPSACIATCTADSASALYEADESSLATRLTPYLTELHTCLTGVGGARIRPAVLLQFRGGAQVDSRLDLSGYEAMACVRAAHTHEPVSTVRRASTMRCELRCRD